MPSFDIYFAVDALAKLSRYQSTLDRSLYRALHELERLQARRRGVNVPVPVAVDIDIGVTQTESESHSRDRREVGSAALPPEQQIKKIS